MKEISFLQLYKLCTHLNCTTYKDHVYSCVLTLHVFAVHGSVHHSTILTEKPNKMQQCIKILLSLILNEAQHVLGDIIRSLKLHKQPLVLHTWKVVGRAVV